MNLVKTWRDRLGLGASYPLYHSTAVERAMEQEIAELRAALKAGTPPAEPGDIAGQWVVIGGQRMNRSNLTELQQEAARYRWLRDKADNMVCMAAPMVASLDATGRVVSLLDGEELDTAVDAVMSLRSASHAPKKTHRKTVISHENS
jgi:hypothetical protein